MDVYVLGAGAIGSYYGAIISKSFDGNISLIGRQMFVDSVKQNGLEVTGNINENFKLNVDTKIRLLKKNDLILLTTKVTDSKETMLGIKSQLDKSNSIICLQNGIGSEDIVKQIVNDIGCKVYRAITNFSITFIDYGKIEINGSGYTKIEKSCPTNIFNIFNGLNNQYSENLNYDVWKKNIVNCFMNPLTAIFNCSNEKVTELPIRKEIIMEIKTVLDKEGIIIENEYYNGLFFKKFSKNISSMLNDVRRHKKTEIDYITGPVLSLAKKHNLEVPKNQWAFDKIKEIENSFGQ